MEEYLDYLLEIVPKTLEEYSRDNLRKAACERYFEKVIEAVTDIAFMIIVKKKWIIPEDDADAFRIVADKNVISEELHKKLKSAKGMRNFLAHQYGRVDDEKVYEAITEEIEADVQQFITEVKKNILK